MSNLIKLNKIDNVAMARKHLNLGEEGAVTVIPKGHKIALCDIAKGQPVIKYAQIIGYASEAISSGSHVHTENLEFRSVKKNYKYGTQLSNVYQKMDDATFLGFQRPNGKVGTRNTIAILTSVNCSATAARLIAEHFDEEALSKFPNVDYVTAYVHGTGCGMADSGDGFEALQRVMWGYAKNPNVAAVLMVGLGCEMNQIDWLIESYGLMAGPLFQTMNIQDMAGLRKTVEVGIRKVSEMLHIVNANQRTVCPVSELTVALQCGGSDAWSGITANPALGFACDLLVSNGGTGVLAETPEIYGAEHLLTERAVNEHIGTKLLQTIEWWEDYTHRNRGNMDNNPSPGNKKGGLTTILEKSLGAVAKGGTTPLTGVFKYAEEVRTKGFVFMDSPGYDPASVTGQIAGGCNLVAFTTGRGSAFGSKPSPCIKIATNSTMFERMVDDMDVNAGEILTKNLTIEEIGYEIFNTFIAVASGQKTKSEEQGLGDYEFVPWQIGAVM